MRLLIFLTDFRHKIYTFYFKNQYFINSKKFPGWESYNEIPKFYSSQHYHG